MPIRSSVCAYSPLAASGTTASKYSGSLCGGTNSAAGRYSSVLPAGSSLSYGQYKPFGQSAYTKTTRSTNIDSGLPPPSSATKYGLMSSSPSSSSTSSSSSSYSPGGSSTGSTSSSMGLYRPLTSSGNSRNSFNAGSRSYTHTPTPTSRYSMSNLSLSSNSGSESHSSAAIGSASQRYANQSSSAYSSASSSSSSTAAAADHYSKIRPSPRPRRLSYTSQSSLSESINSYQTAPQDPLPDDVPNGLVNLGNTCYMNACLQALYSLESFRKLILSQRRTLSDSSMQLTSELGDLFTGMKDSHRSSQSELKARSISPTNFKNTFARKQTKFANYGQQDAQEFLRYLVNAIHEESNKARQRNRRRSITQLVPKTADEAWKQYQTIVDDSPFVDLLVGQFCSTITCSQCNNKSHCWDPFWDLSLPLVNSRGSYNRYECNLLDLIGEFTVKETLDSDDRPTCERCKQPTKSTKQISLARLPQVLILHLKKFTNDGYKLSSPDVKIAHELEFHDSRVKYRLKACISHHGHSSSSGHYTSHCEYSNRWFHFDDDRVRDVTSSFNCHTKLNDAYVLFYVRSSHHSKL